MLLRLEACAPDLLLARAPRAASPARSSGCALLRAAGLHLRARAPRGAPSTRRGVDRLAKSSFSCAQRRERAVHVARVGGRFACAATPASTARASASATAFAYAAASIARSAERLLVLRPRLGAEPEVGGQLGQREARGPSSAAPRAPRARGTRRAAPAAPRERRRSSPTDHDLLRVGRLDHAREARSRRPAAPQRARERLARRGAGLRGRARRPDRARRPTERPRTRERAERGETMGSGGGMGVPRTQRRRGGGGAGQAARGGRGAGGRTPPSDVAWAGGCLVGSRRTGAPGPAHATPDRSRPSAPAPPAGQAEVLEELRRPGGARCVASRDP